VLTTSVLIGTFARVWLTNLVTNKKEDQDKVFALKILRKTDGTWSCFVRTWKIHSDESCSYPPEASRTRSQRAQCPSRRGRTSLHHNNGRQFPRPRFPLHAGKLLFTSILAWLHANLLFSFIQLDYCPGGEVFSYLRRARRFNESTSQFYAAEIVLILEFLHDHQGVAYRDLKPENILIDAEGHLKLVDFGFAKKVENSAYSFSLPILGIAAGWSNCQTAFAFDPSHALLGNWFADVGCQYRRNIHVVRNARIPRTRSHSKYRYVMMHRRANSVY
jgi:serine/threonine protein kinase